MFNSGAFDCKDCPKTNDLQAKRFCPAWWEEPWYVNGVEEIRKACSYRMLPEILRTIGKTSVLSMQVNSKLNERMEVAEELCNNVSKEMHAVAKSMLTFVQFAESKQLEKLERDQNEY